MFVYIEYAHTTMSGAKHLCCLRQLLSSVSPHVEYVCTPIQW